MTHTRRMKFQKDVDDSAKIGAGYKWLYKWLLPYIRRKKILSIGCWTGVLENLIKNEKCNLIGIDIEEEALIIARKAFPKFRFKNADVTKKLPFEKGSFDVAFFFMTIEHLPKGTELIALVNINNVLKKNGILFMSTVNSHPVANLFDPCYFLGHRHYSSRHLTYLLHKAGFEVLELKIHGGISIIIYTFLFYVYKHIFGKIFFSKQIDRWMEKEYYGKGFVEIKIRAKKIKHIK